MIGWADAGELEKLRRVEGAAGKDDLTLRAGFQRPAVAPITHPGGAPAVNLDRECQCSRFDGEVRAARGRRQIPPRDAPAPAIARRAVVGSEALLLRSIYIGRVGISRLDAGLNEGLGEGRALDPGRGDRERTLAAVVVTATLLMGLGALEIGQKLGIGPAAQPLLGPVIIVAG